MQGLLISCQIANESEIDELLWLEIESDWTQWDIN